MKTEHGPPPETAANADTHVHGNQPAHSDTEQFLKDIAAMTDIFYPPPPPPEPPPPGIDHHTHQAAESMKNISRYVTRDLTVADMVEMLKKAKDHQDDDDEAKLLYQSEILDSLFHRIVVQMTNEKDITGQPMHDYIDRNMAMIALRFQKECRATIEARQFLRYMKIRARE